MRLKYLYDPLGWRIILINIAWSMVTACMFTTSSLSSIAFWATYQESMSSLIAATILAMVNCLQPFHQSEFPIYFLVKPLTTSEILYNYCHEGLSRN